MKSDFSQIKSDFSLYQIDAFMRETLAFAGGYSKIEKTKMVFYEILQDLREKNKA